MRFADSSRFRKFAMTLAPLIRGPFFRYAVIGVLVNVLLYGTYIILTRSLMGSRTAMSLTYCAGVLIGFALNKKITFHYKGDDAGALFRYISAYLVGYVYNFVVLLLMVDYFHLPHEAVQAGVIMTLWLLLFALQRYWVFRVRPRRQTQASPRSAAP